MTVIELECVRAQAKVIQAQYVHAKQEMERRSQFRSNLCQCWRALTIGHGTIQSIHEAPLTVWLLTGEFP